jgi:hypothetical protein
MGKAMGRERDRKGEERGREDLAPPYEIPKYATG